MRPALGAEVLRDGKVNARFETQEILNGIWSNDTNGTLLLSYGRLLKLQKLISHHLLVGSPCEFLMKAKASASVRGCDRNRQTQKTPQPETTNGCSTTQNLLRGSGCELIPCYIDHPPKRITKLLVHVFRKQVSRFYRSLKTVLEAEALKNTTRSPAYFYT